MKEGYRVLGEYIRQVDIRNKEGKKENLLGVSVQKQFIQSIANTVGTDFTKYKVVKKGQFTYIPDTSRRGDKIAIALLEDYEEGLVSNVYTVFEVIDTEKLLPEYLMLWFSRPEFDRYARFKAAGFFIFVVQSDFLSADDASINYPLPAQRPDSVSRRAGRPATPGKRFKPPPCRRGAARRTEPAACTEAGARSPSCRVPPRFGCPRCRPVR